MCDHHNIPPIEIQIEIIARLPVKSVIRFACVSKQWNSLIRTSKFVIDHYSLIHTQQQKPQRRLYVLPIQRDLTGLFEDELIPYLSFVDDDDDTSFPQNKSLLFVPESVNRLELSKVAGSSHGLFCLVGRSFDNNGFMDMAVIWNPMIRKSVPIAVPNLVYASQFGFGVCPKTHDLKIVTINPIETFVPQDMSCTNWQVEVFTLSSGAWRRIPSPAKWLEVSVACNDPAVSVDGFIYWVVNERISSKCFIKTLISFDLTSEEFKQVYLPDKLLSCCNEPIQIFKFGESLAIFARENILTFKVWIMEEKGALKEMLTIDGFFLSCDEQPVFRSNGQLIFNNGMNLPLLLYTPDSNQIKELEIYGNQYQSSYVYRCRCHSAYMSSNTESLFLLDQSDTLTVRCK